MIGYGEIHVGSRINRNARRIEKHRAVKRERMLNQHEVDNAVRDMEDDVAIKTLHRQPKERRITIPRFVGYYVGVSGNRRSKACIS